MINIKLIPTAITLIIVVGMNAFGQSHMNKTAKKSFAVLELFTSEGCSSCPPADELMRKIQNEYQNNNLYVLAYHIDYWDKQGWKDIFSDAEYTNRQYAYAKWLKKAPIYTPQVIINGKSEYIASQETVVRNAIIKALSKPAITEISLNSIQNRNSLETSYIVTGAPKNSNLLIAIVQKSAKNKVKKGENGGRILSHYQIVRHLHSIDLNKTTKGNTNINLPKEFNFTDFEVIGLVQEKNNGQILGVSVSNF